MTYKFTLDIRPAWHLRHPVEGEIPLQDVLNVLAAIETTGHIAGACREIGVSYRHAWGLLRRFETAFDVELLQTKRRLGTTLTPFAQKLLWADRRIQARLSPTLDSLASELQEELQKLLPDHAQHLRLHASHGFAVAALMQQLGDSSLAVELRYRSSSEAMAALAGHECELAGFHVPQGEFEAPMLKAYARWLNPQHHVLIHLAYRNSGLFIANGNPKGIAGLADLARPDLRFVNRQAGSGTRMLLELMVKRAGIAVSSIQGFDITAEFTHAAVAAHIASDMADVGMGVETAGRRFGLDFIPLVRERYFFAAERSAIGTPAMQALIATLRSSAYRDFVQGLAGYDAADTGMIQTVDEAFSPSS